MEGFLRKRERKQTVLGKEVKAIKEHYIIFTWQVKYLDHESGFPRVSLIHCTPDVLTPAISLNVGNLTV